jgi:hypothetical protein
MSFDDNRRIHYFHSEGTAIGGYIFDPPVGDIPVQAPATLSPAGGLYAADNPKFEFGKIISARRTSSVVKGHMSKDIATTSMRAEVEDLCVVERVQAEKVVAYISTTHSGKGLDVPSVDFSGTDITTDITGLQVDDALLEVVLDLNLLKSANGGGPPMRPVDDKALQQRPGAKYNAGRGFLKCSLAKEIRVVRGKLKGEIIPPNVLKIIELGTIHVAELLLTGDSYELIMLRFALGCPTKGDVTVSAGKVNGQGGGP